MLYKIVYENELYHHGVKGMKWGVRRYQNEDGSLTPKGRAKMLERARKYESKANTSVANNYFAKARKARLIQKSKDLRGEVKRDDLKKYRQRKKERAIEDPELAKKRKLKSMTDEELEEYVVKAEKRKKLEQRYNDLDADKPIDKNDLFESAKKKELKDMSIDELNEYVTQMENRQRLEKKYSELKTKDEPDAVPDTPIEFDNIKNKKMKEMSDEELDVYVTQRERRKKLEERYKDLTTSNAKKTAAYLTSDIFKPSVEALSKQMVTSIGAKFINEKLIPLMADKNKLSDKEFEDFINEYKVFTNNKKK